eukprot:1821519-Rhodomonas_salina.2
MGGGRIPAIVLQTPYAVPGTDLVYAATRSPMMVLPGSGLLQGLQARDLLLSTPGFLFTPTNGSLAPLRGVKSLINPTKACIERIQLPRNRRSSPSRACVAGQHLPRKPPFRVLSAGRQPGGHGHDPRPP